MVEPKTLKHYEILSRLGAGGMGVVYRARDTRLGRIVALKTLPAELAGDKEQSRRFEREARIVSAISHPGIATLYDFDREGEVAFLTMEFVEGPTLRDLVKVGPMPIHLVLECAVEVADALAAAHNQGVVHRDIKPENIMMAKSGHFKVLDFGVARREETSTRKTSDTQKPTMTWATKAGTLLGTVAYMSPEQTLGQETDLRSDVFSFGSLVYELATGRPAFQEINEIATAQAISLKEPVSMSTLRTDVPEGLELIVKKCLTKKREDRYQSTEDLLQDLRTLRQNTHSGSRSVNRLRAYEPVRARRRNLLLAGGLVLFGLVAAGLLFRGLPGRTAPSATDLTSPGVIPPLVLPDARPVSIPQSGKPRVIVTFFENNSGDPSADWLSKGLPEMLTTDLSRTDELEVIATQRIYDLLALAGRERPEALDRSTAAELARWAGADLVISGSVFKAGNRYRIDAQAYDTTSGTVAVAHKVEGTELFQMVNDLTAGLREGLKLGTGGEGDLQGITTSSELAFEIYVRGKSHYKNLQFGQAEEAFRQALEIDPDFATARLRLAMSLVLMGDEEGALLMIAESAKQAERMPEDLRLVALALNAYFRHSDFEKGTAYLEKLLQQYPEETEAYVWWARALSQLKGEPLEATRKLRKAIERDPNNLQAIAALSEQLADLGALEDALGLLRDALSRNPEAREPLEQLIQSYRGS